MKLKIVSDGTSRGTHVVNSETDEKVEHVSKIEWSLDYNDGIAYATFSLLAVAAEVEATGVR